MKKIYFGTSSLVKLAGIVITTLLGFMCSVSPASQGLKNQQTLSFVANNYTADEMGTQLRNIIITSVDANGSQLFSKNFLVREVKTTNEQVPVESGGHLNIKLHDDWGVEYTPNSCSLSVPNNKSHLTLDFHIHGFMGPIRCDNVSWGS